MSFNETDISKCRYVVIQERCCGAYNYTDYSSIRWNNHVSHLTLTHSPAVPVSCCKYRGSPDFPPHMSDFLNLSSCLGGNAEFINDEVCIQDAHVICTNTKCMTEHFLRI